ncbi:glycosyl hydrolase family 28-related protein [Paenibacillus sp. sgz500958]|uniref:glycosyl hydrolase family 28-related protein n=1 Tax=Paenibacillus sp. sgz500958 TaxID=3242475 RepID=UPI0036D3F3D5
MTLKTIQKGSSVYTGRPEDPQAVYLTPDNFPVAADGIGDDSEALQQAINSIPFGIVFIPEGSYRISRTIYVPKAIRLIGYGQNRPVILLGENTPGFQTADPEDKGNARYMIWFTDKQPEPGQLVQDANPGTFYSALSNINLVIEDGNPAAVALRTHYAQHGFISHCDIHIGNGKAGIFDVGNEIEDVRFFGGEYGIYTTKPSPGWPFLMIDTCFEHQRKAAIRTREGGLTILRMDVRSVPVVIDTDPKYIEKLYMEDCRFDEISGPAIVISHENNAHNQINLKNVHCRQVPVLAAFLESGKQVEGTSEFYRVAAFTHGNQMDEVTSRPAIRTTLELEKASGLADPVPSDIPALPGVETWVNVRSLGAAGDGTADDTLILQAAIEQHPVLYLPQGMYKVTETLRLKPDTVLIGMNPITTQIVLPDNTEVFGGLGKPKALIEAPSGGTNILYGIGVDTGGRNPRAVGCKWMAGAHSYMNDIKFMGGHGGLTPTGGFKPVYNANRTADISPELRWDSQYWSLWVTQGGGGVFKDIWTASPYAAAGFYVSDTSTAGRIYAMSVEHHVRHEVKFKKTANWKIYALQMEEEVAESRDCLPLELDRCREMLFANTYFFRTIWLDNPYPYATRTWECEKVEFLNVHNYTQIKYTLDNTLYDVTTDTEVRAWELARLHISGDPALRRSLPPSGVAVQKLAGGFEFADTLCKDSKGNIYFADSRRKQIYHWSAKEQSLRVVSDLHHRPLSLACDRNDRLLVVVEYFPPKGATVGGQPEIYTKPDDAGGTSYGDWYNVGSTVKIYAIDPEQPEESLQPLPIVPMDSFGPVHKALYPGNRWRDSNDFLTTTVQHPKECFVAPDGVTIIPVTYDLMRSSSLQEARPGEVFYALDEYYKRTVAYQVSPEGFLSDPRIFAEKGEHGIARDCNSTIYIADGDIYGYRPDGTLVEELLMPERPAGVIIAGEDQEYLYITARSSFYRVKRPS